MCNMKCLPYFEYIRWGSNKTRIESLVNRILRKVESWFQSELEIKPWQKFQALIAIHPSWLIHRSTWLHRRDPMSSNVFLQNCRWNLIEILHFLSILMQKGSKLSALWCNKLKSWYKTHRNLILLWNIFFLSSLSKFDLSVPVMIDPQNNRK